MYRCHICGAPLDHPGTCPECGERPVYDWMDDKMPKGENMERNEKFTPGPWYIKPREEHQYQYHAYSGTWHNRTTIMDSPDGQYKRRHVIATVARGNGREDANAALMVVAPEMYAYGEETVELMRRLVGMLPFGLDDEVKAQIAKWEGLAKKARGEEWFRAQRQQLYSMVKARS